MAWTEDITGATGTPSSSDIELPAGGSYKIKSSDGTVLLNVDEATKTVTLPSSTFASTGLTNTSADNNFTNLDVGSIDPLTGSSKITMDAGITIDSGAGALEINVDSTPTITNSATTNPRHSINFAANNGNADNESCVPFMNVRYMYSSDTKWSSTFRANNTWYYTNSDILQGFGTSTTPNNIINPAGYFLVFGMRNNQSFLQMPFNYTVLIHRIDTIFAKTGSTTENIDIAYAKQEFVKESENATTNDYFQYGGTFENIGSVQSWTGVDNTKVYAKTQLFADPIELVNTTSVADSSMGSLSKMIGLARFIRSSNLTSTGQTHKINSIIYYSYKK
tara:strand:- start:668 stop:1672 length:1005 start_codon:yes stop_codon:yes gene_type:complete